MRSLGWCIIQVSSVSVWTQFYKNLLIFVSKVYLIIHVSKSTHLQYSSLALTFSTVVLPVPFVMFSVKVTVSQPIVPLVTVVSMVTLVEFALLFCVTMSLAIREARS